MTASLKQTNKDRKELAELCVSGFIRGYCVSCEMPEELTHLCLLMYLEVIDQWNTKICNGVKIDTENNTAINIDNDDNYNNWCNAFGSIIVEKGQIQTWKLKRVPIGYSTQATIIGIIEFDKLPPSDTMLMKQCFATCDGFAVHAGGYKHDGDKETNLHNGPWWGEKDIVKMTLDLSGKENKQFGILSYQINEQLSKIVFDTIDINKKYCMAISTLWRDDGYQIIE